MLLRSVYYYDLKNLKSNNHVHILLCINEASHLSPVQTPLQSVEINAI